MQTALQVVASLALVTAVLWFMWRLPDRRDGLLPWASPLALLSAWTGLAALGLSVALWFLGEPDPWVAVLLLLLDPAALASGVGVLWLQRGFDDPDPALAAQKVQARVGIALGVLAVVFGYAFVLTHKTPFTPVGT